jgi:hypothetical protein
MHLLASRVMPPARTENRATSRTCPWSPRAQAVEPITESGACDRPGPALGSPVVKREFRRSATFGIVGVIAVAAATVAIGLSASPTDANPNLQYGLIFGVVAVFFVALFLFQSRDLNRGAGGDARDFAKGPRDVDAPTSSPTASSGRPWR